MFLENLMDFSFTLDLISIGKFVLGLLGLGIFAYGLLLNIVASINPFGHSHVSFWERFFLVSIAALGAVMAMVFF